jgi:hypothetical protein
MPTVKIKTLYQDTDSFFLYINSNTKPVFEVVVGESVYILRYHCTLDEYLRSIEYKKYINMDVIDLQIDGCTVERAIAKCICISWLEYAKYNPTELLV